MNSTSRELALSGGCDVTQQVRRKFNTDSTEISSQSIESRWIKTWRDHLQWKEGRESAQRVALLGDIDAMKCCNWLLYSPFPSFFLYPLLLVLLTWQARTSRKKKLKVSSSLLGFMREPLRASIQHRWHGRKKSREYKNIRNRYCRGNRIHLSALLGECHRRRMSRLPCSCTLWIHLDDTDSKLDIDKVPVYTRDNRREDLILHSCMPESSKQKFKFVKNLSSSYLLVLCSWNINYAKELDFSINFTSKATIMNHLLEKLTHWAGPKEIQAQAQAQYELRVLKMIFVEKTLVPFKGGAIERGSDGSHWDAVLYIYRATSPLLPPSKAVAFLCDLIRRRSTLGFGSGGCCGYSPLTAESIGK